MGNVMFISTLFVSGLYGSIYMLPAIIGHGASSIEGSPSPLIVLQALPTDIPSTVATSGGAGSASPFPSAAQFETADTWVSDGRRYRLYGLQACLRGTRITASNGVTRDCGELNVIMVQAMIKDTKPICETVGDIDQNNAVVVCRTTTGQHKYDLATYLIAQGWGFAAIDGQGQLIVPGYRIAEESARSARMGLWASSDLPHPISVLQRQGDTKQ